MDAHYLMNFKKMTTAKTPLAWILFFLLSLVVLNEMARHYSEPREILISQTQAREIGQKIWLNEADGRLENLVVWNQGEDFPSLGIGHFIWYPQGVEHHFQESFPGLLEHLAKTQELPAWLVNIKYPPWHSREQFLEEKHDKFAAQLRQFLQDTMGEQTQYIINRLENALPLILKEIKNPFERKHVEENFYHIAMQQNGVYALVDYVNFKGEGLSPNERYKDQGWGLAQVLQHMWGKSDNLMQEFVDAADYVLTRRVNNAARDESRWLPGWRKRLQTYLAQTQQSQ